MKKGFWDFASAHPIATFFITVVTLGGIADIISSATGHFEPGAGYISYSAETCARLSDGQFATDCTMAQMLAGLPAHCHGRARSTFINNWHEDMTMSELETAMGLHNDSCVIMQGNRFKDSVR